MEETEETVQDFGLPNCEAVGISEKERKALEVVEVVERAVLSGVVYWLVKGKC